MRVLLFVFVVLVCGSCFESGDCVINNTNLIKINLINSSDNTADSITFNSIQVENTAIVLYQDSTTSYIELPVNPSATTTTFILNYREVSQRITFTYDNETVIPSSDCGAYVYQKNVTVGETTFNPSQIVTTNNQLLRNATDNFEIYF